MLWLILLCFGLLVWLTFRLGAELFSPWVGVVAALVVLTRPALERDALLGYQDTAFACLIVGAVLLEARRARRGEAVLGLLVLAGLMRPEAWVLGGLYFLWMWPAADGGRRLRLAAMVVAAPLIWALSDLLVTGDALHSLHGTADLAEAVDRRRDIVDAPYWTAQYYGYTLREPLVVGIPIGLFFAWRFRRREAILPLVVVVAMTLVFMIGPAFGLPLIGRYVRTPSVLLSLFYGLAVCGFLLLADPRARAACGAASGSSPPRSIVFLPLARRHARRPRAPARPRRAHVRGAARGGPARRRCARGRQQAAVDERDHQDDRHRGGVEDGGRDDPGEHGREAVRGEPAEDVAGPVVAERLDRRGQLKDAEKKEDEPAESLQQDGWPVHDHRPCAAGISR